MHSWLQSLNKLWQTKKTKGDLARAHARSPWQLSPQPNSPDWRPEEAAAILAYEHALQRCAASDHRGHHWQTMVLGADLNAGQILLDEFFPAPPAEVLAGQVPITLQLVGRPGVLEVEVRLMKPQWVSGQRAYLATVLGKQFTDNRTQIPSVQFARNQAPQAQLLLPLTPLLKGHVTELSRGGFTMTVYAHAKPELLARIGDCQLRFSDQFLLKTTAQVKSLQFNRKPCCHLQVHGQFQQLSNEQRDNLKQFLLNCSRTPLAEECAA